MATESGDMRLPGNFSKLIELISINPDYNRANPAIKVPALNAREQGVFRAGQSKIVTRPPRENIMKNQVLGRVIILSLGLFLHRGLAPAQQVIPSYLETEPGWQWPADRNGIARIPVCWEESRVTYPPLRLSRKVSSLRLYSTEKEWVKSAIVNTWGAAANLEFLGWGDCRSSGGGIRISIADIAPFSQVGKPIEGKDKGMVLNFTFKQFMPSCESRDKKENCIKLTAVHMFGHALGYTHGRSPTACNDERGGSRGWPQAKSEVDSVMNYCEPTPDRERSLSETDIRTIQFLYGPKTWHSPGKVLISDRLGQGELWKNATVHFHGLDSGSLQLLGLHRSMPSQTRAWDFSTIGRYCYTLLSYTMLADGQAVRGFGEACLDLAEAKTYQLHVSATGMNAKGFLDLRLQGESPQDSQPRPSQSAEPKQSGNPSIQNTVAHEEFEPVFMGLANAVSRLKKTLREGDSGTRKTLNQISYYSEVLREKWIADKRAVASKIYLRSLALDEALLKRVLEGTHRSGQQFTSRTESTVITTVSWKLGLGSIFNEFRGASELMPKFSADAEDALRDVNEDLRIKALYAASNPGLWDDLVDVSVNSKKGEVVVNGFEVQYVEKGWADSPDKWKRFPQVSSPAREQLAPGNYMMRLASLDPTTKKRVFQAPVPQTVGGDGKSLKIVDLLVP
jgi:hypothetical protein